MDSLRNVFEHAGAAMYLIALGSVLSVALALERLVFLRGFRRHAEALHAAVFSAVEAGEPARGAAAVEFSKSAAAPIYRVALARAAVGQDPQGPADRERRRTVASLKSGLWLQGTLGATMPFIGLFGTVVGVLESFAQIAKAGTSGFAVVSGAISEALLTTAGGIAVAVEAVILYNVFSAFASSAALELNLRVEELVETLRTRRGGGA